MTKPFLKTVIHWKLLASWEVADLSGIPTRNEMKEALIARNGRQLQETLEASTVAICGLGGLGSNIAVSLARAGIGKLILIDFDKVDVSNLNRQQYKASQVGAYKPDALSRGYPQSCRTITIRVSFCTLKSSYFTSYEEDSTRAVSEDRAAFRSAHLVSPRM